MTASEYLSTRAEEDSSKHPVKAALYNGIEYVFAVTLRIIPFLTMGNPFLSLGVSPGFALRIILMFTFYISVAREVPFGARFLELAGLSLTVAAISFGIGYLLKHFVDVDL